MLHQRTCLYASKLTRGCASLKSAVMRFTYLRVISRLVRPSRLAILVVSNALVGSALLVLSRFALAIPAVILDDCRVGQAMFRSEEVTQGKWLTLAALLAKSIVGGYVAAMCPFWLISLIRVTAPLPSWFPWILTVASIIGVTVVEPTMFVGFALLYLKMSALNSAPTKVLTGQLA